ncbi:unnamed protein product [Lota lota]
MPIKGELCCTQGYPGPDHARALVDPAVADKVKLFRPAPVIQPQSSRPSQPAPQSQSSNPNQLAPVIQPQSASTPALSSNPVSQSQPPSPSPVIQPQYQMAPAEYLPSNRRPGAGLTVAKSPLKPTDKDCHQIVGVGVYRPGLMPELIRDDYREEGGAGRCLGFGAWLVGCGNLVSPATTTQNKCSSTRENDALLGSRSTTLCCGYISGFECFRVCVFVYTRLHCGGDEIVDLWGK